MDKSTGSPSLVVFYNHSGEISGAEISLLLTMSQMRDMKTILVAPEGELLQRARSAGICVSPIRSYRARMTKNPIHILRGICGTALAGIEFRRVLKTLRPDIVHANSVRAGLIATVAVVGQAVKLVWHIRDTLPHNAIGRAIRKVAANRVDAVFTISKAIRNNFASTAHLARKSTLVYNGIDTSDSQWTSIRPEFGTSEDAFIVGVVGQIAPWKRQHDAILAFSQMTGIREGSELWIVGQPKFRQENVDYEAHLKEQVIALGVQDRVRFLGFREDIMNVMGTIDVLLIPSENEPFGRVVIEAMLAGKPVIGTNDGGISEIVVHGETGFLTDVGDTDSMSKYLREMYEHVELREGLGEQGRRRSLLQFSIERTAQTIERSYAALLGDGTRSTPGGQAVAASARRRSEQRWKGVSE
ncbi:glycosyltransferase family 4 protein [Alicyclobacillus fastidiosus]|uniref:Glycosyltransferase family 4 protein n=1 Tax=Alicyclobacillus fastidiosus TaxID=392011 RepID=A0ABV5AAD1_9BACL|nr:glycosyltransferase family 4 protein [Alicyclobacillus fastidiosus]WEH07632.1 glycosyltransferase family 4 protein [Alicyclobacillus fastidiosus]